MAGLFEPLLGLHQPIEIQRDLSRCDSAREKVRGQTHARPSSAPLITPGRVIEPLGPSGFSSVK